MHINTRGKVVVTTSETAIAGAGKASANLGNAGRLQALDFTKGALVLFMVLYHWLNYFYGFTHDIYKYLRFLSPSFVFISGFLVSHVYLSKFRSHDPHIPKRLVQRGVKILGVFMVLNLAIAFLSADPGRSLGNLLSPESLIAIFITGNTLLSGIGKLAAFQILVPIGLLLLLSAALLVASRIYSHIFYAACLLCLLGILALGLSGGESANLDVLAMGLLGVLAGYMPVEQLSKMNTHPVAMVTAYLCYLTAITLWNVRYPLQVAGVCLTLMILYLLGSVCRRPLWLVGRIVLLGKYSLFAYIVQIAIIQGLHRGLRPFGAGYGVLIFSFLSAFVLTTLCVEALDHLRRKTTFVDRLYRAVFA